MRSTSSSRQRAGMAGAAALACAVAIGIAGPAQAATTVHPAGASSFDDGAQGWVESNAECGPINPLPLLCTTTNLHDPGVGNPGGSIATQVNVTLNLLTIFTGTGTWTSPPFEVAAANPVTGVAFSYDRRVDDGGLVDLDPQSTVAVTLIDETASTTIPVLEETLTSADAVFAPNTVQLPPGGIVDGHVYRLRIATTTTSSVAGLVGQANTRFDNVALRVDTADPGGGGNGGGNSPGVDVVRGPYSDTEIDVIINQYGGQIGVDTGSGPDGSLIPLDRCTIVGTSGNDVIRGTAGNDVICGLGGDDVITGGGGRDVIDGANGNDRLSGGIGRDLLFGLAGNDRLDGGADADRIGGGAGNDRIEAGNGGDVAHGGSGNDAVGGEAGHDTLRGGAGNDRVNGGPGRDRLYGDAGNDILRGFSGLDRHFGGPGNDRILSRDGRRDHVNGGPGRDRAVADRGDRLRSVERIRRR